MTTTSGSRSVIKYFSLGKFAVAEVGAFEATFVSGREDFTRFDERCRSGFSGTEANLNQLSAYIRNSTRMDQQQERQKSFDPESD